MNKLVVALAIALCGCASAFYGVAFLRVVVRGVIDVQPTLLDTEVVVPIRSPSGETVYDLGTVRIPSDGFVRVLTALEGTSGGFRLLMSGVLELVSNHSTYRIVMPCLVSVNEPCVRIQALLPGYDEALPIRGGEYRARLVLSWIKAEGSGEFRLRISLVPATPKEPLTSAVE